MADQNDRIVLDVEQDTSSVKRGRDELQGVKRDIEDMRSAFSQMDGLEGIKTLFTGEGSQLSTMLQEATALEQKLAEIQGSLSKGKNVNLDMFKGVQEDLKDLAAQMTMFKNGEFSVQLAHNMFGGLGQSVQRELAKSTPTILNAIRTQFNSGHLDRMLGPAVERMIGQSAVQQFARAIGDEKTGYATSRKILTTLIPQVVGAHNVRLSQGHMDYNAFRYGTDAYLKGGEMPSDVLVGSMKKYFQAGTWRSGRSSDAVLSGAGRMQLRDLLSSNAVALKTAMNIGLFDRRTDAEGHLQLNANIEAKKAEQLMNTLLREMRVRAQGTSSRRISLSENDLDNHTRERLRSRLLNGTTFENVEAINALYEILEGDNATKNWATGPQTLKMPLRVAPKLHLDQYEIDKLNFTDMVAGKKNIGKQHVMLSESLLTRRLNAVPGEKLSHNQFSDRIVEVDLAEYDRNAPGHQEMFYKLADRNGVQLPGYTGTYIPINMHGTGQSRTLRYIKKEDYEAVNTQFANQIAEYNKRHPDEAVKVNSKNFFDLLVDTSKPFESREAISRYYDAVGKLFSGSYQINNDKYGQARYAFADFSRISEADGKKIKEKLADGIGWVVNSLLPYGGGQSRFAIAGKGVLQSVAGKTIGEFAKNAGIYDQQKHVVGSNVDLDKVQGIIDKSQIKNQLAYEGLNETEQDDQLTFLMRIVPPTMMQTIEGASSRADTIGRQVMQYVRLTPEERSKQISEAAHRITELRTPQGVRAFLKNSDSSVAKLVREGKMLETDPQVTRMVNNEIRSIMNAMGKGEYIDFTGKEVANIMNVRSPITALGLKIGGTDAEKAAQLRTFVSNSEALKNHKDLQNEVLGLNDEDLLGLFAERKNAVVDFGWKDTPEFILTRSPHGFGHAPLVRNYANFGMKNGVGLAERLYPVMGLSVDLGSYTDQATAAAQEGSDFDADTLKKIRGYAATFMKRYTESAAEKLSKTDSVVANQFVTQDTSQYDLLVGAKSLEQQATAAGRSTGGMSIASKVAALLAEGDIDEHTAHNLVVAGELYAEYADTLKNATTIRTPKEIEEQGYKPRPFSWAARDVISVFDTSNISEDQMYVDPETGMRINKEALRKLNLENTNTRSVNSTNADAMMLAASLSAAGLDTGYADSLWRAYKADRTEEDAEAISLGLVNAVKLRDAWVHKQTQDLGLVGGGISSNDQIRMDVMRPLAEKELQQLAYRPDYKDNILYKEYEATRRPGNEPSRGGFESWLKNKYSVTAYLSARETGITRENATKLFGDKGVFANTDEFFRDTLDENGNVIDSAINFTEAQVAAAEEVQRQMEKQVSEARQREISSRIKNLDKTYLFRRGNRDPGVKHIGVTQVEPWMVDENGNQLSVSGVKSALIDQQDNAVDVAPFTLYRDERARQRAIAEKEAQEQEPESSRYVATELGHVVHSTFDRYYKKGNTTPIEDIFKGLQTGTAENLSDEEKSWGEYIRKELFENGEVFDGNGNLNFKQGLTNNQSETAKRIGAALGSGNVKGTLKKFSETFKQGAEVITEMEQLYEDPEVLKLLKDDKYGLWGEGDRLSENIRTDFMIKDANGKWSIVDFKPSEGESQKSFVQNRLYKEFIDRNTEEALRLQAIEESKRTEEQKRRLKSLEFFTDKGFGEIVNGKYQSNINSIGAYDYSSGRYYWVDEKGDMNYMSRDEGNKLVRSYEQGVDSKLSAAKAGYNEGIDRLNELARRAEPNADNRAKMRYAAAANDNQYAPLNDVQSMFYAQQWMQDTQAFNKLQGMVDRERMTINNVPDPGFSRFSSYEFQLDQLYQTPTLQARLASAKDDKEKEAIDQQLRAVETLRNNIWSVAADALEHDISETQGKIQRVASGTHRSQAVGQLDYIDKLIRDQESEIRYVKDRTWGEDERDKREAQVKAAEERLAHVRAEADAGQGKIIARDENRSQYEMTSLMRDMTVNDPYTKIEDMMHEREESIAQAIEQRKSEIEQWNEKIKQNQDRYKEGSAARKQIDKRIAGLNDENAKMSSYLSSGSLDRERRILRQRAEFQQGFNDRRGVQDSENAIAQVNRWRYQSAQNGLGMWGRNVINSLARAESFKQQEERNRLLYEGALQSKREAQQRYDANKTDANERSLERAKEKANNYKKAMEDAAAAQKQFGAMGGFVTGTIDTITNGLTRLTTMFGRRLFQTVIREARQFVIQFSTQMSQIQSITMKSDQEMISVRQQTIEKAQRLHTNIANVADVEASLYRQGQSDAEVGERTDAIVKFATVTGVKVTAATKYLTSAIQNGLVGSVQDAMDVLVALGDSAATTAEEISKGMQKSAAAAKNAGVSYAELTSMLTIITSKTQLGGTTAGTAQQTIFSRMTRVTNRGSVLDSSGETTTINDVDKALQSAGISLKNPDNPREIRNVFQVLRDLSRVWNDLDDIRKGNISYYMAGGRQVNMFQTLMEGMSENGGKDQDEYLGLAKGSQGITQSKYEIAIDNVQTKITDLKNTFDSMIENIVSDGTVDGIIGKITDITGGLEAITESMSGIPALALIVGSAIALMQTKIGVAAAAMKAGFGDFSGLIGMAAAGIILGGMLVGLSAINGSTETQQQRSRQEEVDKLNSQHQKGQANLMRQTQNVNGYTEAIEEARQTLEGFSDTKTLDTAAVDKMTESLSKLATIFPFLSDAIKNAGTDFEQWETLIDSTETRLKDFLEEYKPLLEASSYTNFAKAITNQQKQGEVVKPTTSITDYVSFADQVHLIGRINGGATYGSDDSDVLNAYEKILSTYGDEFTAFLTASSFWNEQSAGDAAEQIRSELITTKDFQDNKDNYLGEHEKAEVYFKNIERISQLVNAFGSWVTGNSSYKYWRLNEEGRMVLSDETQLNVEEGDEYEAYAERLKEAEHNASNEAAKTWLEQQFSSTGDIGTILALNNIDNQAASVMQRLLFESYKENFGQTDFNNLKPEEVVELQSTWSNGLKGFISEYNEDRYKFMGQHFNLEDYAYQFNGLGQPSNNPEEIRQFLEANPSLAKDYAATLGFDLQSDVEAGAAQVSNAVSQGASEIVGAIEGLKAKPLSELSESDRNEVLGQLLGRGGKYYPVHASTGTPTASDIDTLIEKAQKEGWDSQSFVEQHVLDRYYKEQVAKAELDDPQRFLNAQGFAKDQFGNKVLVDKNGSIIAKVETKEDNVSTVETPTQRQEEETSELVQKETHTVPSKPKTPEPPKQEEYKTQEIPAYAQPLYGLQKQTITDNGNGMVVLTDKNGASIVVGRKQEQHDENVKHVNPNRRNKKLLLSYFDQFEEDVVEAKETIERQVEEAEQEARELEGVNYEDFARYLAENAAFNTNADKGVAELYASGVFDSIVQSLGNKGRGYVDQYKNMLSYIQSRNSVEESLNAIGEVKNFVDFTPFLQDDKQLVNLLNNAQETGSDVDRQKQIDYLATKVLGSTLFDAVKAINSTGNTFASERRALEDFESGRWTDETLNAIASTFGVTTREVSANRDEYSKRYREYIAKNENIQAQNIAAQVDAMMTKFINEGEFETYEEARAAYLDSITDETQRAEAQTLLNAAERYATLNLGTYSNGIKAVVSGGYNPETAPATETFTPEQIRRAALSAYRENTFTNLDENISQIVKSQYGDLETLFNLEDQNSLYAQTIKRDFEIDIRTQGLQDQERAGQLISGIAGYVEQIGKGNVLEQFKGTQQILGMMRQEAYARQAYQRIRNNGGIGTAEDWSLIENMYGVPASMLQSGQIPLEYLEGVVNNTAGAYANTGNQIAMQLLKENLKNNYSDEMFDKIMNNRAIRDAYNGVTGKDLDEIMMTYGFKRNESGDYVPIEDFNGELTFEQYEARRRATYGSEQYNREAAAAQLRILRNGNYESVQAFREEQYNGAYGAYIKTGALDNLQTLNQLYSYLYNNSRVQPETYAEWIVDNEMAATNAEKNRRAATGLYDMITNGNFSNIQDLWDATEGMYDYYQTYLTQNGVFENIQSIEQFEDYLFQNSKYGQYAARPNLKYADVQDYVTALLSGNASGLVGLETANQTVRDYLQGSFSGWDTLVGQIMFNEGLEEADVQNVQQTVVRLLAQEAANRDTSQKNIPSLVSEQIGKTDEETRDALSNRYTSQIEAYNNALKNIDKDEDVAQYIHANVAAVRNMSEEQRKELIDKQKDMFMRDMVMSMRYAFYGIEDAATLDYAGQQQAVAASGNEGNASLLAGFQSFATSLGLNVENLWNNNNAETENFFDLLYGARSAYKNAQRADATRRLIAGIARNAGSRSDFESGIEALRANEEVWKNLEEVYPSLGEEIQTAQAGGDWERARRIIMNIDQEFTTKGLEDLEKAGKVMEGIANTYRQMQEGNPLTQFRAQQGYEGEWLQFLEAQGAANKVFNGTADEADWQTFASFYHISGIERYQRGQLNVGSQQNRVNSVNIWYANEQPNNLYQGLLEQEFISRMRANNYPGYDKFTDDQLLNMMRNNPELVTDEMQTYVGEEMRALGFEQGEDGRWKFNGTAIGEMDWEQYKTLRETLPDYTKQNQATARSLYQQLLAGNYANVEAFGEAISSSEDENVQRYWKELQNANVDLTNMTTDELLDYLINEGYGTNLNRTTLADVGKYIEALRSGNVGVLGELENDRFAQAFLNNNISGWSDMYSRVLSGKTLTTNDLLSLNQSVLRTRLSDWEASNRNYQGLSDEIFTAMYGNTSEQRSLRQQYASRVNAISERARMLEREDWTGLQQSYGWNDQELAYYKKNQGLLRKEMEKESNETGERMRGFVGKALDVDLDQFASFDGLDEYIAEHGNEAQNAMIVWLEQFFSSIGLSLKDFVDKNKLDADSTFNIFEEATDKYAETKKMDEARNFIAEAAEEAGTFEDFKAAIEASGIAYESEFKQIIAGADEATQSAFAGVSDWETEGRERMMRIGETMSAVMRDTEAERMMQQFDKAFAEQGGFTAQANGELEGVSMYDVLKENTGLRDYLSSFEEGTNLLQSFDEQTDLTAEDQKRLAQVMNNQAVKSMRLYGDRTDDVISLMDALRKGGQSAQGALKGINQQMTQIGQNRYYMDKWRGGDRSTETSEAIAAMTGFNAKDLREGKVLDSILEQSFKAQDASDLEVVQTWADTLMTSVNQYFADNKIDVKGPDINLEAGEMDASALQAALDAAGALTQETAAQLMAILEAFGVEGELQEIRDGNGGVQFRFKVKGFSGGSFNKGGGGGGGGGGKSAAQELIDRLKKEQATFDHQIKMIQSQENKYEGAGEFLNLNVMLGLENEAQLNLIDNLEQSIEKLKEQLAQTKEGSDDWYALRDAIMSYEEAIESANRAIEENTRKQNENLKKARQTTQTLEQALKGQIEEQKQIDRDMLGGTVSLQQQILDVIKQRYQEEWDQVDKDLQKKRDALQEEMNMIDERLRRRTEAEDDAEKREELAEMRRQAALIAADPTRSKDYNELMEKIREGEREESRKTAERNAEYQRRMLEQESESLDKASQEGAERLENFLKDANNMAIEINSILEGSYEDAIKWFMANSEEYKNGLDAMQKQFINNVEDTWKQMNHIIDTYWPEINEIIAGGREAYIERMKETDQYRFGSEADREQLVTEWGEQWDNWINAWKTGATYSHGDEWSKTLYDSVKSISGDSPVVKKALEDTSADVKAILQKMPKDVTPKELDQLYAEYDALWNEFGGSDKRVGELFVFINAVRDYQEAMLSLKGSQSETLTEYVNTLYGGEDDETIERIREWERLHAAGYDEGGLVDFTGPAIVHGSPLRPEAFIDAEDTALMRAMLDSMNRVRVHTLASFIDPAKFGGNTQTIGDVNITITEAKFEDDADIEAVAARVGETFVQQLNQQGFTTGKFAL